MAESPIGPAPTTATTSPGETVAVQDANFVAGGQDIGQHEELLVGDSGRDRVRRGSSERHPHLFCLSPIDVVAENPAAAAEALPEPADATEPTGPTRRDARHKHAVARIDVLDCRTHLFDRPDGLVAEDPPGVTSGRSPFKMWRSVPQMVVASTRTIASVSSMSVGSGTSSQLLSLGP